MQARELFVSTVSDVMPTLSHAIGERLLDLTTQTGTSNQAQERRDACAVFKENAAFWTDATLGAWHKALTPSETYNYASQDSTLLELMDNEAMENKIIASRLALRLLDFTSWEFNDLRLRIQNLEGISDLPKNDVLRPAVLAQHLVEQWIRAALSRKAWTLAQDLIQQSLAEQMLAAFHAANEFLVQHNVMVEIDLRPLVIRTPSSPKSNKPKPLLEEFAEKFASNVVKSARSNNNGSEFSASDLTSTIYAKSAQDGAVKQLHVPSSAQGRSGSVADEATPIGKAQIRAQGIMGRLRRMFSDHVPGDHTQTSQAVGPGPRTASPQLAKALTQAQIANQASTAQTVLFAEPAPVYGAKHVEKEVVALRQRTSALKAAASSSGERATIEIVALMFQSILAEDRIPAAVRVWFARLQIPVLRVAISEPEFFDSLQHPARRLIDRMGSCVLGFDASITGGALETEIKRVVQMIEQYPETGRAVFQLVFEEFQTFLSQYLSGQNSTARRVVSVAQQLEQKETLTIQYTIELRSMLNDMPVREEIRDFLFKVWTEVLAIAAIKNGAQHSETIQLKKTAADLVWAVSAKPKRKDRTRVISDLPQLLQRLRSGLVLMGMEQSAQEGYFKKITDTLADAFMSKTGAISKERIDQLAERLSNLEEYLSDDEVGDLPIDATGLAMMIGVDGAELQVIAEGGGDPTEAMRNYAQELQLGSWFSLDHNGRVSQVQFSWRSDRKQLHLFSCLDGRTFLMQTRRLAAYLQASLLVPIEEESLTVRATREALDKIDANPERLLS